MKKVQRESYRLQEILGGHRIFVQYQDMTVWTSQKELETKVIMLHIQQFDLWCYFGLIDPHFPMYDKEIHWNTFNKQCNVVHV